MNHASDGRIPTTLISGDASNLEIDNCGRTHRLSGIDARRIKIHTDMMFAHILRPVRRNQPVIAVGACNSIGEIIVGRGDHHEEPPCLLLLSLAWKNKNIMTVISSNLSIWCFAAIQEGIAAPLGFRRFPSLPLAARRGGEYIRAVKARRTAPAPPTPRPADRPHE